MTVGLARTVMDVAKRVVDAGRKFKHKKDQISANNILHSFLVSEQSYYLLQSCKVVSKFTLFSPASGMSAPDARMRRKISLKPGKVLTGSYVV